MIPFYRSKGCRFRTELKVSLSTPFESGVLKLLTRTKKKCSKGGDPFPSTFRALLVTKLLNNGPFGDRGSESRFQVRSTAGRQGKGKGKGKRQGKEAPQPRSGLKGGLRKAEKASTISTTGKAKMSRQFAVHGVLRNAPVEEPLLERKSNYYRFYLLCFGGRRSATD